MGIPSVKTISFSINRNYSNLSSSNNLFHENIASISISNTSKNSSQILKSATIGSNLSSNISINWSDPNYPLNGTTHYYTSNINDTPLNIAEKVYSLRNSASRSGITRTTTTPITPNHYCDKISIGLSSYPSNVIEIGLITSLSNLNNLSSSAITINNGTTQPANLPKAHTMLFINGKFQFNTTVDYPDVASYVWDSKHTSPNYSAGTTSYNLSGSDTTNNTGYKWIGFNWNDSNGINTALGKLDITSGTYNILQYFNSGIGGKLFSSDSTVVGFIKIITNVLSNIKTYIGDLSRSFNPTSTWYSKMVNSANNKSLVGDIFNSGKNHGALNTDNTINIPSSGVTTIEIYIGIKK